MPTLSLSRALKTPPSNLIQTKKDKQMKATLDLKLFGARLKDAICEIENIHEIFSNPKSSCCEQKSSLNVLKQTILMF